MPDAAMTDAQRKAIFALCRELGWNDTFRREMLERWVGKSSLAAGAESPLSSREAAEVLSLLDKAMREVRRGRREQHRRQRRVHPAGQVTPEQLHRIDELAGAIFGADRRAFLGWLRSKQGVERPEWLSAAKAVRTVHALEQLARSGWHPRSWRAETPTEVTG